MNDREYLDAKIERHDLIGQVLSMGALSAIAFAGAAFWPVLQLRLLSLICGGFMAGVWFTAASELYYINKRISTYEKSKT